MNTGFLYVRKIITIFIALYSTRLILDALGVTDFGIFNLIAGVIAMLGFLKSAMAVSTQRFMSYYLGSGQTVNQKTVFQTSVQLHIILGILLVVLLEAAGLFLFDGFLNIPADRIHTAKIIFHFMVVSTFFTINAVPYDAAINAHEDLFFEAVVGVIEALLKLGIAFLIIYADSDRLILYGLMIAILTILIRIMTGAYCRVKYEECRNVISFDINKSLFKEMYSFAGWNMFGAMAGIGRNQGIAVVLNLFFGATMNAAYGVAHQVSAQIQSFSILMLKALNPQIMKSEGDNDREKMLRLASISSKFSFYLMSFFAFPLLFEMETILNLWLNVVPDYSIIFCQLIISAVLMSQLTIGLQSALQATGNIKMYQVVVGLLLLLNLPISYLLLSLGYPPYIVFVSFIAIDIIAGIGRIYFAKKLSGLNVVNYLNDVIVRNVIPVIVTLSVTYIFIQHVSMSYRFILTGSLSTMTLLITIYFFGLTKYESEIIHSLFRKIKLKISK